jgi:hypothetical protein
MRAVIIQGQILGYLSRGCNQFFRRLVEGSGGKHLEILMESFLNLKINENLINSINELDCLMELFRFFRLLVENGFDKSVLVTVNLGANVVRVLDKLLDLSESDYRNSAYLCTVMREGKIRIDKNIYL